jgi:hypothetical protein
MFKFVPDVTNQLVHYIVTLLLSQFFFSYMNPIDVKYILFLPILLFYK